MSNLSEIPKARSLLWLQLAVRQGDVQLGWLIDPASHRVEIYRPGQAPEILDTPGALSGEEVLPGFTLKLQAVWS
jgi:Uma2 family endonuclease